MVFLQNQNINIENGENKENIITDGNAGKRIGY